ncbi:MAG: DUF362 domain-containing protein [Acidobacteria bacterium]|nr:DUF362 domain-containing protein [Acidobacteriota bacterium]
MSQEKTNRRQFLERSSRAGLAALAASGTGLWLWSRNRHPRRELSGAQVRSYQVSLPDTTPPMVTVTGGSPDQLVSQALQALGGMQRFVSRGDVVVLKPNIGWDRVPQQAANTNPDLVRKVVELCFDAGAHKVVVTDVSCNDPRRCFQRSGIAASAESAGATVILPEERKFRDYRFNGELLSIWPVFTPIVEADKVINLPIVKHHNLCRATMGLKNWYGMLGGRRNQLHQNIDISVVDLATFIRPTLTILDAYRVLISNGPQGGNLNDVRLMKTIAAGTDPVAIDAFGATLLGLRTEQLPYLAIAQKRGLGRMDFSQMNVKSIQLT